MCVVFFIASFCFRSGAHQRQETGFSNAGSLREKLSTPFTSNVIASMPLISGKKGGKLPQSSWMEFEASQASLKIGPSTNGSTDPWCLDLHMCGGETCFFVFCFGSNRMSPSFFVDTGRCYPLLGPCDPYTPGAGGQSERGDSEDDMVMAKMAPKGQRLQNAEPSCCQNGKGRSMFSKRIQKLLMLHGPGQNGPHVLSWRSKRCPESSKAAHPAASSVSGLTHKGSSSLWTGMVTRNKLYSETYIYERTTRRLPFFFFCF